MSTFALKVENLSKKYQLGEIGTRTLHKDIKKWWYNMRGLGDPFAKIGQVNDRTQKATEEFVWSLRNINFEVKKGDVLGVIGRNGAGKSTLLKIISKITTPTSGSITIHGRISSLLEVGTGFHPEMTGRENIFMNGAILGMRKWEIQKKFDEIVEFAGVAAYVDTPVKRYSSGMIVRLGFSVAAHLEPDILIVDEVLAVGDAEFQKKCIGKMKDVSTMDGRTVLFVSHNLGSVASLCNTGLLLNNGGLVINAPVQEVLSKYAELSKNNIKSLSEIKYFGPLSSKINFNQITINNKNPFFESIHLAPQEDITLNVCVSSYFESPFRLSCSFYRDGVRIITLHDVEEFQQNTGEYISSFTIPSRFLRPGIYTVGLGGYSNNRDWIWNESVFDFEIIELYDQVYEKISEGIVNIQQYSKCSRRF